MTALVGFVQAEEFTLKSVTVTHSEIKGIGAQKGVMRHDPSDIIKVGDLYDVWYSKGTISPGYDATVWYATSSDGRAWTESILPKRTRLKKSPWAGGSYRPEAFTQS